MTITVAQVVGLLVVGLLAATVHLVARRAVGQRVLMVDLGRPVRRADRAAAWRVRVVNAVASGVAVLWLLAGDHGVATGMVPLLALAWMLVEMLVLARSAARADLQRAPRMQVAAAVGSRWTDYLCRPLWLAQLVVLVVPTVYMLAVKDQLPALLPMQWGPEGHVSRVAPPSELWLLLAIMVFDLALVGLVALGVSRERSVVGGEHAAQVRSLQHTRRRLMVRLTEVILLSCNAFLALLWLSLLTPSGGASSGMAEGRVAFSCAVLLLGTVGPMAYFTPRLVAVGESLRAFTGTTVPGTDPEGWRAGGLVYYAPADPTLFVPKRVGLGQTLNFARPAAWLLMVLLLGLPLVSTVLLAR